MIAITETLRIPGKEVELRFVRAGGPGGQHVNKASTAVQLRFDVEHSESISEEVRARLKKIAGKRLSDNGVLVIEAARFRSQKQNREDAIERFVSLLRRAASKPKKRRPTKPTAQAKKRRLEDKRRRAKLKRERSESYS
ncbi:MAG TPA: alternative ribosome rescue aminoacyl-tRNA hydrolase ArfB [Vicinamibacteria bacterium]|nr:alternative ribosome rescue aminoacyl-tRNA hydrolase ArfB [Vicinamibacteria bacterium]